MQRTWLLAISLVIPNIALAIDYDGDGADALIDNCPGTSNPDQADVNGDGFGDACVSVSASVDGSVILGRSATIASGATVASGVSLGRGVSIGVDASIGQDVYLGEWSSVGARTTIGMTTVVQRSTTIASDVVIGSDVQIGRSSSVGAGSTLSSGVTMGYANSVGVNSNLGADTVLGNLVSVGTDVVIAPNTVIARSTALADDVQVGVAPGTSSVTIGPNCLIDTGAVVGAGVRIRKDSYIGVDNQIGDNVRIGRGANLGARVTVGAGAVLRAEVTGLPNAIAEAGQIVPRGTTLQTAFDTVDNLPDPTLFNTVWHITPLGSDSSGDGSEGSPFNTLTHAVTQAQTGDGVFIHRGTYRFPVYTADGFTSTTVHDLDKGLHIWGENEKTILLAYGEDSPTARDFNAFWLRGENTVVSNMKVLFKPNRGTNYTNAIFRNSDPTVEVRNIWVQNVSSVNWSFSYANSTSGLPLVFHSVFDSRGLVTSDYSGSPIYDSVLFSDLPGNAADTLINTLQRPLTSADLWLESAPSDLRDGSFTPTVGTAAGTYPWSTSCPPDGSPDFDDDGLPDSCDPCPSDALQDSDGDGVCDSNDACLSGNDSVNADGDALPDACDPCPDDATDSCLNLPDPASFGTILHVSPGGSDGSGTGTTGNPFQTLDAAVTAASAGDAIEIHPGTYDVAQVGSDAVAIRDQGKQLHIYGANAVTVLRVNCANYVSRDCNAVRLNGSGSVLSNVKVEYTPNRSANYSNAIFSFHTNTNEVRNVWFENTSPSKAWSYVYDNNSSGSPDVFNCVFDGKRTASADYTGTPSYRDTLFFSTPSRGTKTWTVTRTVTTPDDLYDRFIPTDLRNTGDSGLLNANGSRIHIGTAGGMYAWP
ncbi:MAG: UDP-3-O-[3-hydroxymyristoyl] glucosamine N-acyltransferase [Myxococcota bacterium]|jgi:UDP-3-O-[3-hydroxymyristoyl] glucosamine N-acyltransferase